MVCVIHRAFFLSSNADRSDYQIAFTSEINQARYSRLRVSSELCGVPWSNGCVDLEVGNRELAKPQAAGLQLATDPKQVWVSLLHFCNASFRKSDLFEVELVAVFFATTALMHGVNSDVF